MTRSVRLFVVVCVVVAPLAAVAFPTPPIADTRTPASAVDALEDRLKLPGEVGPDGRFTSATADPDREVQVVVQLKRGAAVPEGLAVDHVYTRQGARHAEMTVQLSELRDLWNDPRIEAVRIDRALTGRSTLVAPGVGLVGADVLHDRGIRGANVTVGIIDAAFQPTDPEIAANVRDYRSFESEPRVDATHGTAVASVVVDTAPEANLKLAAVGTTTTPEEYADAAAWLDAAGADVIVDAGSYFGHDDTDRLADVAAATADDTLFVTSAGNYAQRHWVGRYDPASGRPWVAFGDHEGNALNGGEPFSGHVYAAVTWNATENYHLYLLRERAGADEVVAESTATAGHSERIDTTVDEGRYYLSIRAANATGRSEIELFASHELAHATPNGSLTAPGTAPGVLTVGAYANGSVKAFSSRGSPGAPGVDLVAPDSVALTGTELEGTSFAAPYVAGTAALLQSEYPGLSARQLGTILTVSARDVAAPGPDIESGSGHLDARSAYLLAISHARYAGVTETSGSPSAAGSRRRRTTSATSAASSSVFETTPRRTRPEPGVPLPAVANVANSGST